jgi:hypothetical protein
MMQMMLPERKGAGGSKGRDDERGEGRGTWSRCEQIPIDSKRRSDDDTKF